MDRYMLIGACLVDNEDGEVKLESLDTPKNRRRMSKLVDRLNRRERDRAALAFIMGANRCAWL